MNSVRLLKQVYTPTKVICIGRNYVEHIAELKNEIPDNMVVFAKPNSAISDHLQATHGDEKLHYECELTLLVEDGKYVGMGLGLDLTKRDLQSHLKNKGLPWERAKGFNGAAVLTDFVPLPEPLIWNDIAFELKIDGELIQFGDPALMMYSPIEILKEITSFMQPDSGDIIMTGTPKGVGQVKSGSAYTVTLRYQDQTLLQHEWIAE